YLLTQEAFNTWRQLYRPVSLAIHARRIATERDEFTDLLEGGVQLLELAGGALLLGTGDLRHATADRGGNVDGRIVPCIGQPAGQHDVSIENGSGAIHYRVLLVVTLGQHRVQRTKTAALAGTIAGTFHQFRQHAENRRRVTLGGRRLAQGQGNFALGHGVAGQRIHQQQHILALI